MTTSNSTTSTSTASSPSEAPVSTSSAIGSIWTTFHWSSFRSRHIRGFITFFSNDYVKLNDLSVTNRSHCLLGIVLDDSCLMNENILLGVIPIDETVSTLDIKPLDGSTNFCGYHLLRLLLLQVPSLLLCGLGLYLRVCHDVNVVWMVTNFFPRLFSKMAANLVVAITCFGFS